MCTRSRIVRVRKSVVHRYGCAMLSMMCFVVLLVGTSLSVPTATLLPTLQQVTAATATTAVEPTHDHRMLTDIIVVQVSLCFSTKADAPVRLAVI